MSSQDNSEILTCPIGSYRLTDHFRERSLSRCGVRGEVAVANAIEPSEKTKKLINKIFFNLQTTATHQKKLLVGRNYIILMSRKTLLSPYGVAPRNPIFFAKTIIPVTSPALLKAIALDRMTA